MYGRAAVAGGNSQMNQIAADADLVVAAREAARELALCLRPDELHQAFYFDLLMCP